MQIHALDMKILSLIPDKQRFSPFISEVYVAFHIHAARLRLYHLLFDQNRRSGRPSPTAPKFKKPD